MTHPIHRPLAALALALGLALASQPTRAEAGEAEVKAATELVRLVTPKAAYDDMMTQMTAGMMQTLVAQGQKVPPDAAAKIQKAVGEVLPYEEMITWSAEVYATRFTVSELKELTKFYKTPLGSKLAKALPDIMGEVGKKMATILPERMPGALKRAGLTP